jgi:hypothetical protein
MKVLHLPSNVASQISVTVRALRDIGVDARGVVIDNHPIQDSRGIETFSSEHHSRHPVRRRLQTLTLWRGILSALRWADVIHWHYSDAVLRYDLDLKCAALMNKARIVEFWGTDIRIPEVASADNPYWAELCRNPEVRTGSFAASRRLQAKFAGYGFECLLPDLHLLPYVQKDLFPSPHLTRQRILLSDFEAVYPRATERRPLVVHCPSHKVTKGTQAVLNAIGQLKSSHNFDFRLIHGVPRAYALSIVRQCDIMLDQFVGGAHGLAALEAMAFGKPTLCYIKPSLVAKYPPDLPIVNANQDNLADVLRDLLEDGQRRHEIGRRSRAYVEEYHDAHKIARQLVRLYEELLRKKRKK